MRRPTTVRLSDTEKDVLKAAARRVEIPYTRALRRAGLRWAADVLTREVDQLRGGDGREVGGGTPE